MEDNLLAGINEYKIITKDNPIAYTRDICTCIICLLHRENSSILMHIGAYKDNIELDDFMELLKTHKEEKILSAELFIGPKTYEGNVSIITFILERLNIPFIIKDVFKNLSNETSVGYNYNTKEYLYATMDKDQPILKRKRQK